MISRNCSAGEHKHCGGQLKFANADNTDDCHPCECECHLPGLDEDYPGQKDEIRRQETIEQAVCMADTVILTNSNGSEVETDYLTAAVAMKFMEKVFGRAVSQLLRAELAARHGGALPPPR